MLRVKDAVTFRVLGVRQHGTWPGTVGKRLHPTHLPSQHNGMKEHEFLEHSLWVLHRPLRRTWGVHGHSQHSLSPQGFQGKTGPPGPPGVVGPQVSKF